ncbi:MAG: tyrosine-type recombinase/integrase [Hespellia sp.]|nr:tyrosine-type recombinase/integrase [Hespellia sp.]
MIDKSTYHEQEKIEKTIRLRELMSELPPYVTDYFRANEASTSVNSRISYAYDLKVFFQFLQSKNPDIGKHPIRGITLAMLSELKLIDFEEYQEHLKLYNATDTDKTLTNGAQGISRKLSSLRSLFSFLYKHEMIAENITEKIQMPKIHDKAIIQLDPDEIALLLDYIEDCGKDLSPHKLVYYKKTAKRDFAIFTLLLGTGIRVSECVGLDINDVDFKSNGLRIIRKGGNEMIVYFGSEVCSALESYLEERTKVTPITGHENALFLSMQKKRISVAAVENLVKKYTEATVQLKKITPHKLRSTYGTNLYRETGDIYLVADVLGHSDVNTTKKHYAKNADDRRRAAASAVRLRE